MDTLIAGRPAEVSRTGEPADTHTVYWHLLERCNFDCAYCFRSKVDKFRRSENPDAGRHSPQHIAESFDRTGKIWRITLTGGEVFLYRQILDLAESLTRRHWISINTNLSTPNVEDFAARVPPARVHALYASLHVEQRSRIPNGFEQFVRRVRMLQDRGFRVPVIYVAYPPLFERLLADRSSLLAAGVAEFSLKTFRGRYEGRLYPEAYTQEQRALLLSIGMSSYETETLNGAQRFRGRLCNSGHNAFRMDLAGNLMRCNSVRRSYGNLFDGTYEPDSAPRPCPLPKCDCPNQGLRFALAKTANPLSELKEVISYKLHRRRSAVAAGG